MKTNLKEITSIQVGYSFRTRLESINTGTIAVIQMKDLTAQNYVDCSGLMRIDMEKIKEQHLAKPGDVIFRSRGQITTSAILLDDPGKAVVAAPLIWIRVTDDSVLPEYLNWYISQMPAQAFLSSNAVGTTQKMISKHVLEKLEVFIPTLARQRAIIELAALAEKEQHLMKKIADKRRQYVTLTLLEHAKGE
ncbi:MAG: restriction endonuclease subunit S [Firmicutes bacterium]|nr:restriction endonuclease subunit S [Bacillota bacterium]